MGRPDQQPLNSMRKMKSPLMDPLLWVGGRRGNREEVRVVTDRKCKKYGGGREKCGRSGKGAGDMFFWVTSVFMEYWRQILQVKFS